MHEVLGETRRRADLLGTVMRKKCRREQLPLRPCLLRSGSRWRLHSSWRERPSYSGERGTGRFGWSGGLEVRCRSTLTKTPDGPSGGLKSS